MSDWSAGYTSEIGYTFGYYPELGVTQIPFLLALRGLRSPEIGTALELGFGQGLSVNIHAATTQIDWWGTDFNPSQASFARELAIASGTPTSLYDDSFQELSERTDLPRFDFICLHGIWSWISDKNRSVIVKLIKEKLNVGGIVYVSYNTMPGWAGFSPLRHLMTQHAELLSAAGTHVTQRIDRSISFTDELLTLNPQYLKAYPAAASRIDGMKSQSRQYLAHEYFNNDWHPMHFDTMAELMAGAKLQYAGPADFLSTVNPVNLTDEQQEFLNKIPDLNFRESTRDFITNAQFRKDYWIKGPTRLSATEQSNVLRDQALILVTHHTDVDLKVSGPLGELNLSTEIYKPLIELLSNHKPKKIREIEADLVGDEIAGTKMKWDQLIQAITVLMGKGNLRLVQETPTKPAHQRVKMLNQHILAKAWNDSDITALASPVLGGGLGVTRIDQLLVDVAISGNHSVDSAVEIIWKTLKAQGTRFIEDGKELMADEENMALLRSRAEVFEKKLKPIFNQLKIL